MLNAPPAATAFFLDFDQRGTDTLHPRARGKVSIAAPKHQHHTDGTTVAAASDFASEASRRKNG
jgi:hypothetical protein